MKHLKKHLLKVQLFLFLVFVTAFRKQEVKIMPKEDCLLLGYTVKWLGGKTEGFVRFNYDENKRLILEANVNDDYFSLTNYTYSGDSVIVRTTDKNNTLLSIRRYRLNSLGFVAKSVEESYYSSKLKKRSSKYEYDFDKNLISESMDLGGGERFYTYKNDNLVREEYWSTKIHYGYYLDKPNLQEKGRSLFGKPNKNLLKWVDNRDNMGKARSEILVYEYDYEFDEKGYVTKKVEYGIVDDRNRKVFSETYNYIYKCD